MDKDQPVIPQLDAQDFSLAEHVRNVFRAEVGEGITRKDIINPSFWAHIGTKVRPYDEITVIRRDGTLYARVIVLQSERTWARVYVTDWHDLTTRDVALSQTEGVAMPKPDELQSPQVALDPAKVFELKFKGMRMKWCVIRQHDGQVVREGEPDKKAAQVWLDEYLKVIA